MADRLMVDTKATLSPASGTYVLLMRSRQHAVERVGAWGDLAIELGWYLYVGSAFGPGGLRSRVLRHWRRRKPRHWHVGYLREHLQFAGAWCGYAPERLEHRWAIAFARLRVFPAWCRRPASKWKMGT